MVDHCFIVESHFLQCKSLSIITASIAQQFYSFCFKWETFSMSEPEFEAHQLTFRQSAMFIVANMSKQHGHTDVIENLLKTQQKSLSYQPCDSNYH